MTVLILILVYLISLFLIHLLAFILWDRSEESSHYGNTLGDMYTFYSDIFDLEAGIIMVWVPLLNIFILMFLSILFTIKFLSTLKIR